MQPVHGVANTRDDQPDQPAVDRYARPAWIIRSKGLSRCLQRGMPFPRRLAPRPLGKPFHATTRSVRPSVGLSIRPSVSMRPGLHDRPLLGKRRVAFDKSKAKHQPDQHCADGRVPHRDVCQMGPLVLPLITHGESVFCSWDCSLSATGRPLLYHRQPPRRLERLPNDAEEVVSAR